MDNEEMITASDDSSLNSDQIGIAVVTDDDRAYFAEVLSAGVVLDMTLMVDSVVYACILDNELEPTVRFIQDEILIPGIFFLMWMWNKMMRYMGHLY